MKKLFKDFKAFISKGNILDLAVAVIIGGAFGKIVTSLVNDLIMPIIGLMFGKVNISELKVVFRAGAEATETAAAMPEAAFYYGRFIQSIIDFLLVAIVIFIVLRLMMRGKTLIAEQIPLALERRKNRLIAKKQRPLAPKKAARLEARIEQIEKEIAALTPPPPAPPEKSPEELRQENMESLLTEIRDIMKSSGEKPEKTGNSG